MASLEGLPISISMDGTRGTKTGRWSVMKPFFEDKMAPCRDRCPGSINIPKFLMQIQENDIEGAWRTILEENPLPRITGRVCFHPCEGDCNRGEYDQAIAINSLERFIGDQAFDKGFVPFDEPDPNGKKVAVVGSGPAGIGCAHYLLRMGYRVSIFEAMAEIGGLLRYGIPEYRLPKKVLSEELEMALGSGIEIKKGIKIGKDLSWDEILSEHQGVFLGVGAYRPVKLGIEGEEKEGVVDGLQFLRTIGERVPFEQGQKVLIVGGGNTAIDVARTVLRQKGIPKVLYRRSREEMPAFDDEIREAEKEGIEIDCLVSPKAILIEGERVKGVECLKNRLTTTGTDGRKGFVPIDGSEFFLQGDLVVTAPGQLTEVDCLPPELKLKGDTIFVDEGGSCGPKGIYAGGDATASPRSVIHALASGKEAARAIDTYLKKRKGDHSEAEKEIPLVDFKDINLAYFTKATREAPHLQPPEKRISDFKEIAGTFSFDEAAREASRCFGCGNCNTCGNCYFFCPDFSVHRDPETLKIFIDNDYCKGCCICVEECPRGALSSEVRR